MIIYDEFSDNFIKILQGVSEKKGYTCVLYFKQYLQKVQNTISKKIK